MLGNTIHLRLPRSVCDMNLRSSGHSSQSTHFGQIELHRVSDMPMSRVNRQVRGYIPVRQLFPTPPVAHEIADISGGPQRYSNIRSCLPAPSTTIWYSRLYRAKPLASGAREKFRARDPRREDVLWPHWNSNCSSPSIHWSYSIRCSASSRSGRCDARFNRPLPTQSLSVVSYLLNFHQRVWCDDSIHANRPDRMGR